MSVYMFKIIVSKDMIVGSDKPNYPLLIDSRLALPSEFWTNVLDPNGLDIRFYVDQFKVVEYKREIVRFNAATNEFESWVQISILLSSVDTIIYCEVGNGNLANDNSIWSVQGHQRVYHSQNNSDSSPASDDLTIYGASLQPGKISKCYDFDGVDDYAELDTNPDFDHGNACFASAWIYFRSIYSGPPTAFFAKLKIIFSRMYTCTTSGGRGWYPFIFGIEEDGKLTFHLGDTASCSTGHEIDSYNTDSPLNINTWYHVGVWIEDIAVNSPSRVVKFFVNGQLVPSSEGLTVNPVNFTDAHDTQVQLSRIGGGYRGTVNWLRFDGLIDEMRIVEDATDKYANGNWQETEYNNQNDPNLFITVLKFLPIPFNIIYRLKRVGNLDKPDDSLISWLVGSGGHFDGEAPVNDFINDHIARAVSLVIEQFEESKTVLLPLLKIYVKQIQDLENAINSLIFSRNPEASTFVALDIIGVRVGEPRNFRNDNEYRQAIFVRAALNLSSGEPESVIDTLKLATNTKRVWYSEVQSATIDLEYQSDFLPPVNLIEQLNRVSLGGVQVLASYVPDGLICGFDGEGPVSRRENAGGLSEVDYAPGGEELGGRLMEMI